MNPTAKHLLLLLATQFCAAAVLGATFTVTNTNSSGSGSLAQAIIDSNAAAPGPNVINFNIAGAAVKTITGTLPFVTRAVTINGYSQPGSSANTSATSDNAILLIQLSNCALTLQGGGSTVKGLVINGGSFGITISSPSNSSAAEPGHTIVGNFIGTDPTGTVAMPCSSAAIYDFGSRTSGNQIGGTTAADRNLISGNTNYGLYVRRATIQGNFIGTNAAGTSALPNGTGVFVWGGCVIGGTTPGSANVVSGNNQLGVFLGAPPAPPLAPSRTDGDTVQGNFIGTAIDGVTPLPNKAWGILVGGITNSQSQAIVSNATIGGLNPGAGNIIANNGLAGVVVANAGVGNAVLSNSIYNNKGLGIDLGDSNGKSPNDTGDPDTGANNFQNFPVLTSASSSGGATTIIGRLNSTPSSTFRLQFFATPSANSGGNVEGQTLLGNLANVTTNSNGDATFTASFAASVPTGQFVTATATSATNDTSEFSDPVIVNAGNLQLSSISYSVNESSGTVTITVIRVAGTAGTVSIHYATSDGTATAGADYTQTSGDLTFADGETSKTVNVPILTDSTDEGNETFNFTLSAPGGGAGLGSPATAVITILGGPVSHLANISTRLPVQTGDNILIVGFIIQGNAQKKLVVRGMGPSLPVPGALSDPTLELHDSGALIAANDNWIDNPNAAEISSAGVAPTNSKDSALLNILPAGFYTAVLRGKNDGTGIGLVELYDLDADSTTKLVNLATRGFVLGGDNVMIAGLIITGSDPSQLVIRALGPSLGNLGVPTALADPLVELHNGNGAVIFTNNNWRETQEAAIRGTGLAPSNDSESAILISLVPGNYTAVVKGADGGAGNGLVEIYKLSP